ncbi:MAG: hypothetical protein ACOYK6_01070 [Chthoniobacterales bacterium]
MSNTISTQDSAAYLPQEDLTKQNDPVQNTFNSPNTSNSIISSLNKPILIVDDPSTSDPISTSGSITPHDNFNLYVAEYDAGKEEDKDENRKDKKKLEKNTLNRIDISEDAFANTDRTIQRNHTDMAKVPVVEGKKENPNQKNRQGTVDDEEEPVRSLKV